VVPELNDTDAPRRERILISGDVPDTSDRPTGCCFHSRCSVAAERRTYEKPELVTIAPGREVTCHFPRNVDTPVRNESVA
jgi:peptide/nickel transport system ATP-binding protein